MNLDINDLEHVSIIAKKDLLSLKNSNIFITGGTGYIGKWILESLFYANEKFTLNLKVIVLSRNPIKFKKNFPLLARKKNLLFIKGDICKFKYPMEKIDYVIHGATDIIKTQPPLKNFDVITNGTKYLLEFCIKKKVKDILILSTGAVYGEIPKYIKFISEKHFGHLNLNEFSSAYSLGKLVSEWLGNIYCKNTNVRCKHARIFAQIGPYLALDKHFVVGNFISNIIKNEDIIIKGNGNIKRSFMYGSDLVIWLLAILLRGTNFKAYNVGSNKPVTIKNLARIISKISGHSKSGIRILNNTFSKFENRNYVPNTSLAKKELSLRITIPLKTSLTKTISWYSKNMKNIKK
jgi:nucleoside-diphosphate-sugar epimerase